GGVPVVSPVADAVPDHRRHVAAGRLDRECAVDVPGSDHRHAVVGFWPRVWSRPRGHGSARAQSDEASDRGVIGGRTAPSNANRVEPILEDYVDLATFLVPTGYGRVEGVAIQRWHSFE